MKELYKLIRQYPGVEFSFKIWDEDLHVELFKYVNNIKHQTSFIAKVHLISNLDIMENVLIEEINEGLEKLSKLK